MPDEHEIIAAPLVARSTLHALPVPVARLGEGRELVVRPATPGSSDLAFIDALQKMHAHMVGWFPTKQLEAYVAAGNVLIAEERFTTESTEDTEKATELDGSGLANPSAGSVVSVVKPSVPVGYCIAKDRYMGRDDVGIIYQLNVLPGRQRSLVGAALIKAVFERAAYGCRLFCCWCAQDIAANYFWESLGFVPLAFRAGSRGKQRVHIFWQRRVREGDDGPGTSGGGGTPYWFPSQTHGGAVREDRLVLPIPPGTHWRDAKPTIFPELPGELPEALPSQMADGDGHSPLLLPGAGGSRTKSEERREKASGAAARMAIVRSRSRHLQGLPAGKAAVITAGGLRYVERGDGSVGAAAEEAARARRAEKSRGRNDPRHVAAARELRDRYLEHINSGSLLVEGLEARGKYDVSRVVTAASVPMLVSGE